MHTHTDVVWYQRLEHRALRHAYTYRRGMVSEVRTSSITSCIHIQTWYGTRGWNIEHYVMHTHTDVVWYQRLEHRALRHAYTYRRGMVSEVRTLSITSCIHIQTWYGIRG